MLTLVIVGLTMVVSNGQEIDSILLSSIKENFEKDKSVNIEFPYYSHHAFDDPTNLMKLLTILQFLKKHKIIKIELTCHSDCRGLEEYNLKFTQKKSENIKSWFVHNGINQARIRPIGKGEIIPIEECILCNCEANKHQKNRRIEILKID